MRSGRLNRSGESATGSRRIGRPSLRRAKSSISRPVPLLPWPMQRSPGQCGAWRLQGPPLPQLATSPDLGEPPDRRHGGPPLGRRVGHGLAQPGLEGLVLLEDQMERPGPGTVLVEYTVDGGGHTEVSSVPRVKASDDLPPALTGPGRDSCDPRVNSGQERRGSSWQPEP